MVNFQIKKMFGRTIDSYKIIGHLGTGGNADVFKVQKDNNYFAMKMLVVSDNKSFNKKYSRFKDEIYVVKENQKKITGIIPIIDIYLPEKPAVDNRPWYTMPIAIPLSKKNNKSMEDVISCVYDLSKILVSLHEKNIVHRDIKPSNIYYYKDKWAFGDFGLVEYPEKTELTEKGESVGPRNTIAPEMKRNAIQSDGKPADIYSLAKTLWILLTDVKDGFDGQYSHKVDDFNLDSKICFKAYQKKFTVTLHTLLKESTSNTPSERPVAMEFKKMLEEWFILNQNYKKRNILEWEFYLRDIIPFTLPEKISWTRLEDICNVLSIISNTNLNHMFFPGGGGMDLDEVRPSNEDGFLELKVGYLLKLKPKRLTLNTFDASFDWNYFYLETEEIESPFPERYTDEKLYDLELVEISPGEYLEYEDQKLTVGRQICLHLSGGFVLFAKGSYYNSISSTYDARHNRGTAEDFRNYIQMFIDRLKFEQEHPEIAEKRKEEARKRLEEKRKKESELFKLKLQNFKELWEEKKAALDIPNLLSLTSNKSKIIYNIKFEEDLIEKRYYFSKNFELVHYATGWYEAMNKADEIFEDCLGINDFNLVLKYVEIIENHFSPLKNNKFDIPFNMHFEVTCFRTKQPAHIFSKKELLDLLNIATKNDRICIDFDGRLQLASNKNELKLHQKQFPVINTMPDLEYIENDSREFKYLYFTLLEAWENHLECNEEQLISDWDFIDLMRFDVEKKYEDIEIKMNKYPS
ncbi:protein kinase [Paenibacillus sp. FSL R7-0652]|uniref:protein kinase domain-containing protein n=1 Tax=Paenibacillus sp. FSL R7-0652 TaxID=2921687 RepID=UPI00315AB240